MKLAKEFIEENLAKGYIVNSKSAMASPLFFVERRTEQVDLVRTIGNSMTELSRMPSLFPTFKTSYKTYKEWNTSPNSMYNGDTTTSRSNWKINGKQHSQHPLDYTNQQSCSLDYAIHIPKNDEPHPLDRSQRRIVQSLYGLLRSVTCYGHVHHSIIP